jgi:hypothetical protein
MRGMREPDRRRFCAAALGLVAGRAAAAAGPGPAADNADADADADAGADADADARLLALDPARLDAAAVRDVLAHAPAPRILLLHGSVPLVTMAPFARFLAAMGYPAERLRHPRDGALTRSSRVDSREIAGTVAWHYERDGLMPLLIGHSQGGMVVLQALQDLAGASGPRLPVWDPQRGAAEGREAIVDPLDGTARPVVGLQVPYAAALATGRTMRVLLGQWDMLPRLRSVPDTVAEFSGYFVAWDPIAGTGPDAAQRDPYRATGRARVRNVMLPASYGHLRLPLAEALAADPAARAWIEGYDPAREDPPRPPELPGGEPDNIVHAADIWYSVKRHWCLQAQRRVRALAMGSTARS